MRFQTDNIFANASLNYLCDRIYELIEANFPPGESGDPQAVKKNFLLTGRAADIIQGATAQPINNLIFITDESAYFKFCQSKLAELLQCQSIVLKDRILLYPLGFYFEIWFSETTTTNTMVGTIYYQINTQIPTETK